MAVNAFRLLPGTTDTVWQCTKVDVAAAYPWAGLYVTGLARRVASDVAARGRELETVMTDDGSEFRLRAFGESAAQLGARRRVIQAGRPQTNGDVVRYLDNNDHGHSGRRTRGRAAESAIGKAELWS